MRVALMVSAAYDQRLIDQIANDETPQKDFLALADALDAQIIHTFNGAVADRSALYRLYDSVKMAWRVFRRRKSYDVIITDVERVGLILAIFLKFSRSRKRHIMICHGRIVRPLDIRLIKTLSLHTHINKFVCYGQVAAQKIAEAASLSPSQVTTVFHAADHNFWKPSNAIAERLIASAGLSRRDYPTLIEAVREMDVSLDVAAFSPWAPVATVDGLQDTLPPNVTMQRRSPAELRRLYAKAMFVAVPLQERMTQVGSLVIYEAMAMGKAVVVTRTTGQAGMGLIEENETGLFVAPGDVQGWKHAIRFLLDNPGEAERMGNNARKVVEDGMNMNGFVDAFRQIVQSLEDGDNIVSRNRSAVGA